MTESQITSLLELRAKIKEKKPDFIRQDYQRRKRIGRKLKWVKPKGVHSKIRHKFKGWRKMPSPGYKSPVIVKSLHTSGLRIVLVSSLNDMKKINAIKEGAVISGSVGMRKRLDILRKAKELKVTILNLNANEQIKKIEEFVSMKKKTAKKEEEKKAKAVKKEEISGVPAEPAKPAELTDEQKKEIEKEEKDKLLTKRK